LQGSKRTTTWLFELSWWLFAILLAVLVLLPIYTTIPEFPFFYPNAVYIIVAITLTRYLFLLDVSWLRDRFILQAGIALALIPLIFYMVQEFNAFIIYFDERGPDALIRHLGPDTGTTLDRYMHAEYRFFGVWAVVAAVVTPFRLIYNVWVRYKASGRR
jgi:hypothetical protein